MKICNGGHPMSSHGETESYQNGGAHLVQRESNGNCPYLQSNIEKSQQVENPNVEKTHVQNGVCLENGVLLVSVNGLDGSHVVDVKSEIIEDDDNGGGFDGAELEVQKMEEWLKTRGDDPLMDFDERGGMKQREVVGGTDKKVGKSEYSTAECKTVDELLFVPSRYQVPEENIDSSSENTKKPFPVGIYTNIAAEPKSEEITKVSVDIEPALKTTIVERNGSFAGEAVTLSLEDHACLQELEQNSQLTAEEQELLDSSKEELEALEFRELDKDNTLMTPQELESMPERGLEFEESVGPKDLNLLSQNLVDVDDCTSIPLDIAQTNCLVASSDCDNNKSEGQAGPGQSPLSATLATISITTDKSNNTVTQIVINTTQGQSLKITGNMAKILGAAGAFQPVAGNNLLMSTNQQVMSVGLSEGVDEQTAPDLYQVLPSKPTLVDPSSVNLDQLPTTDDAAQIDSDDVDSSDYSASNGKTWSCSQEVCRRTYNKKCKLKVHLVTHSAERPFRCDVEGCDWSFATAYKLKRHAETHDGKKDYTCDVEGCRGKFTTIYNLKSHKKLHMRPNVIKCAFKNCHMRFATQRKMELHLKVHEGLDPPYKCPSCGKEYYTANSISTHMRVHQKGELKCAFDGCDKVFDKACRLKQHMRQHTGERPYVCDIEGCRWAFVSASKLTRHMRKHTGERRYVCSEDGCGKSFMRAEHLQGHMVVHSHSKPFACPHENCSACFTAKSSLYVHMKKHTGGGEKVIYPCPIEACDKKYNCKSSLRLHMLKFHTPVLADNQLDYITLLSNEELQEIAGIEAHDMTRGVTVSVPSITIPVSATATTLGEATLVSPSEFITSANFASDILAQQISDGIVTQLVMNGDIGQPTGVRLDTSSAGQVVATETEAAPSSRVLQANHSGSARTDFCSNHLGMERGRKGRGASNLQQIKLNLPGSQCKTVEAESSTVTYSPCVETNSVIPFRDAHFVQTPLLQDDPIIDLYQDDSLLVTSDLSVPVSLLSESSGVDNSPVRAVSELHHSMRELP